MNDAIPVVNCGEVRYPVLDELRLYETEKRALEEALGGVEGEIYLFGSRLDPRQRGGDIDVLIIPANETQSLYRLSLTVATRFQKQCEEKIDVVVLPKEMNAEQRAFFRLTDKVRIDDG